MAQPSAIGIGTKSVASPRARTCSDPKQVRKSTNRYRCGTSYCSTARGISVDDIGPWLTDLGLERYIEAFRSREIDLEIIPLLSDDDLREIGLALGPRRKVLHASSLLPAAEYRSPVRTDVRSAERRHLTILFCDLVASTEYAERLDPEDFGHLVETFVRNCTTILQRHSGLVANFQGDAISGYFGYPVAEEDDAERALLAGLEILYWVDGSAQPKGQPVQVRLGVASGQVVVGNLLGAPAGVSIVAFGHVPHLAARLQTLAQPNTILADSPTYQAASGAIEFEDAGRHRLKGFSDLIQAWKPIRARILASRFAKRASLTRLVGRDLELRRLIKNWEEVSATRHGRAIVIAGEAGIGKSRLLNELQRRLTNSNQMMFQCFPSFEHSTLYPFLTELKNRAGILDADNTETKLQKLVSELQPNDVPTSTALSILSNLLSISHPEVEIVSDISSQHYQNTTKRLFLDWIGKYCSNEPLLLIFEDEQWADTSSRELLNDLIGKMSSLATLVLVSVRKELEISSSEGSGLLQLQLYPLDQNDTKGIIFDICPTPPGDVLVKFISDRSEGVPLYIEELTRSALETGLPLDQVSLGSAEEEIPSSLQSLLLARLDRLGAAKVIAQTAATIGREFDLELLCEVSQLPPPVVRVELTNLVHSGLIIPKEGPRGPRFSFKHALLQHAAEQTILRERRQELHAQIAKAIESRNPESQSVYPELLARHFADGGIYDRAAHYWHLAGLKAAKTWAKTEAAQMFKYAIGAIKLLPATTERIRFARDVLLEFGDVHYAAFGYMTPEGSEAYHEAIRLSEELGDPEARIRALDGLFGGHFNSGQFSAAIGVSDRLIALGESRDNLKALVLGLQFKGMTLFCQGQLKAAQQHLERALEHRNRATEIGSDFPNMALIYLSWTTQLVGDSTKALDLFREAQDIVRSQAPYPVAQCLGNGCILFALRDETDKMVNLATELLPLARENGFELWAKMAQFFTGWTLTDVKESSAGIELMQETIQTLGEQEVDKTCYLFMLAKAYMRLGQSQQAMKAVTDGLVQSEKIGEHYCTAELIRLRGELEAVTDPARAETSFREAIALARSQAAGSWLIKAETSLEKLLLSQQMKIDAAEQSP